jgi:membrane protein DedA with SNARE-associated domain
MDVITWLQDGADQIPEWVRWVASAGFAALEVLGLGPFIPGEIAVLLLGATFDDVLPALVLVLAVTLGASAGDHVLYALGRRFGSGIRGGRIVRRLGVARWDAAIAVVERRGPAAIIATRLVPVVRTLTPLAAGTAGVPQFRFTAASLVGSLTWALAWGGSGFLLKSSITAAEEALGTLTWVIAGGIVLVVLVVVGVRLLRARGLRPRDPARGRRSARIDFESAATWSAVAIGVVLGVTALVTAGGTDLPATAVRAGGGVTAVVAVTAALLTSGRRGARNAPAFAVARFVLVAGLVVVGVLVHGLSGAPGLGLVALLGVVELSGRSSRSGLAACVLAAVAAGVFAWPWAWSGPFAGVGTAGSAALFVAIVLAAVAAVRVWRDRLVPAAAAR